MGETIVEIEQGKIKGQVLKNFDNFEYCSFKGIPYAKPPIGELRFTVSMLQFMLDITSI